MKRLPTFLRPLSLGLTTAALLLVAQKGFAQTADINSEPASTSESVAVGQWQLTPLLELRSRVQYRQHPFDTGGVNVSEGPQPEAASGSSPTVKDQWFVLSRARLGLRADRGAVRAVVQLQDARLWGSPSPQRFDARDTSPSTGAFVAYAEVHGAGERSSFLRVGRQQVVWGEGRLLGASDWSLTPHTLDAARAMLVKGDFDLEGFASLITSPGALPPEVNRGQTSQSNAAGAQLYGVRIAWHIAPLLHIESNNLARIVREPTDNVLRPSDLYLNGLRISGDYRALSYSLEGAYEQGKSAVANDSRKLKAYAAVARVDYTTGLWWKLGIGLQGAYATGQKKPAEGKADADTDRTRFDPILPDVYTAHGPMGLYAWSNLIEGAGLIHLEPMQDSRLTLGYRNVSLAKASDAWQSSSLVPIGQDPQATSRFLGHELDATLAYSPWAAVRLLAGYGAFLTSSTAKHILELSGRGRPEVQHFGYLQATVSVP